MVKHHQLCPRNGRLIRFTYAERHNSIISAPQKQRRQAFESVQ
jgi:hypothetical protein